MLWLRKGFGFSGPWTVREQNHLLALCETSWDKSAQQALGGSGV
jgi:hypothetical protein